jgi:hypothetical protein
VCSVSQQRRCKRPLPAPSNSCSFHSAASNNKQISRTTAQREKCISVEKAFSVLTVLSSKDTMSSQKHRICTSASFLVSQRSRNMYNDSLPVISLGVLGRLVGYPRHAQGSSTLLPLCSNIQGHMIPVRYGCCGNGHCQSFTYYSLSQ